MNTAKHRGFTLVELLIVVAIIGVLAGIAMPAYNGYIETTTTAATETNAVGLAGFEDTYFYENGTYLAGTYAPPTDTLSASLGWKPTGDKDLYTYVVEAGSTGIATSYKITVTSKNNTSIKAVVQRP